MTLNDLMEFDHVVLVHEDGSITEPTDVYPPELFEGELSLGSDWTLMNGYSRQDGYSGPVMHNSEFIGGQMERDIRSNPGYYVALVCTWLSDEWMDYSYSEGWVVAHKEL